MDLSIVKHEPKDSEEATLPDNGMTETTVTDAPNRLPGNHAQEIESASSDGQKTVAAKTVVPPTAVPPTTVNGLLNSNDIAIVCNIWKQFKEENLTQQHLNIASSFTYDLATKLMFSELVDFVTSLDTKVFCRMMFESEKFLKSVILLRHHQLNYMEVVRLIEVSFCFKLYDSCLS